MQFCISHGNTPGRKLHQLVLFFRVQRNFGKIYMCRVVIKIRLLCNLSIHLSSMLFILTYQMQVTFASMRFNFQMRRRNT